jgi:hyperosmotically inducible protein
MSMDRRFTGGLFVAALLALGAAGCAADKGRLTAAEPRGPVQTTADAGITAKVKTALAADGLVKARKIDVDTVNGVVQLSGTVDSMAEKERALSLARNISGVTQVIDNLKTSG